MNPTAPSTNRILIALLESGKPTISSRVLSDLAGVSPRAASDTMRFLEFHGGLSSRREIRWRRTAEILGMLRLAAMNPARSVSTALDGPAACAALQEAGIEAALGFTSAANAWAFFEPHRDLQVFISRGLASRAAAVLNDAALHGAPDHEVTLFVTDLNATSITTLKETRITSRLQTWIDLAHFPRAGAHEAFFRKIIRNDFPQADVL